MKLKPLNQIFSLVALIINIVIYNLVDINPGYLYIMISLSLIFIAFINEKRIFELKKKVLKKNPTRVVSKEFLFFAVSMLVLSLIILNHFISKPESGFLLLLAIFSFGIFMFYICFFLIDSIETVYPKFSLYKEIRKEIKDKNFKNTEKKFLDFKNLHSFYFDKYIIFYNKNPYLFFDIKDVISNKKDRRILKKIEKKFLKTYEQEKLKSL